MKMVYVPYEILQVLLTERVNPDAYLDVNTLLNILSPEDISFYLFVNLMPSVVVPEEVEHSFTRPLLKEGLFDQIDQPGMRKEIERLVSDYCVKGTAPQLDLSHRLLTCQILYTRPDQVVLLTHRPDEENVMLDKDPIALQAAFYESLLSKISMFMPLEQLASMEVFAAYLKTKQSMLQMHSH